MSTICDQVGPPPNNQYVVDADFVSAHADPAPEIDRLCQLALEYAQQTWQAGYNPFVVVMDEWGLKLAEPLRLSVEKSIHVVLRNLLEAQYRQLRLLSFCYF